MNRRSIVRRSGKLRKPAMRYEEVSTVTGGTPGKLLTADSR